jgi:hypothetical protein
VDYLTTGKRKGIQRGASSGEERVGMTASDLLDILLNEYPMLWFSFSCNLRFVDRGRQEARESRQERKGCLQRLLLTKANSE